MKAQSQTGDLGIALGIVALHDKDVQRIGPLPVLEAKIKIGCRNLQLEDPSVGSRHRNSR